MGKIITDKDLSSVIKELRENKKKIVATNGCFDILHIGHVRYLKKAKALGDVLIVAVNSDKSTRELKGPSRPINSQNDRMEILSSLTCVDYVILFDKISPVDLLLEIKPDIYAKGGDYTIESLPEAKAILSYGGKVELIDFVDGKSTTNLINKINN